MHVMTVDCNDITLVTMIVPLVEDKSSSGVPVREGNAEKSESKQGSMQESVSSTSSTLLNNNIHALYFFSPHL